MADDATVGIGAAGSEVPLAPPVVVHASSTSFGISTFPSYWIDIPVRSRLVMRESAVAATNLVMEATILAGRN